MADNPPSGMGGFFPGLFGDLMKLLQTGGPFPIEVADQLATSVSMEDGGDQNPDPRERMRLENLLPLAELHVADVTGMTTTTSGHPLSVASMSRVAWARRVLTTGRPLIERLAAGLVPAAGAAFTPDPDAEPDSGDQVAAFLQQWMGAIAPAMVAMQFGSLVGHLARRTLGQYTLPLPYEIGDELGLVPANLVAFALDWSVSIDDLCLAVLVRDVTTHAVLARPHVRARLTDLLARHAAGLQPSPEALEERLGGMSGTDMGDIGAVMGLLGDPAALGQLVDTPELRAVRAELGALGATISGYVEWVATTVGERAIGAHSTIGEALRRARGETAAEDRGGDALFGDLTAQRAIDRGAAFVRGVLERTGEADLARLWVVESNLPTAAEVDAPGLWLERINLPPLDGGAP